MFSLTVSGPSVSKSTSSDLVDFIADSFVGKCTLRATTFLGFSVSLYRHFHSFVIKGSKNLRGKLFTWIVFLVFPSKVPGEKKKTKRHTDG